jgi:hypothetical protein
MSFASRERSCTFAGMRLGYTRSPATKNWLILDLSTRQTLLLQCIWKPIEPRSRANS